MYLGIYETTSAYPVCHHSGQLIITPDGQQNHIITKYKYKSTNYRKNKLNDKYMKYIDIATAYSVCHKNYYKIQKHRNTEASTINGKSSTVTKMQKY